MIHVKSKHVKLFLSLKFSSSLNILVFEQSILADDDLERQLSYAK